MACGKYDNMDAFQSQVLCLGDTEHLLFADCWQSGCVAEYL